MSEKNKNMDLWSRVEKTDPKYTKRVNQRGGFTAIGAQYQLQEATRVFGPFGQKWGIRGEKFYTLDIGETKVLIYTATFFYEWQDSPGVIEMHNAIVFAKGNRIDDDAHKKVTTDSLTKALSRLGFNADVFMDKFSDHKYVESLVREKQNGSLNDKLTKSRFVRQASKRFGKEFITAVHASLGLPVDPKEYKEDYEKIWEKALSYEGEPPQPGTPEFEAYTQTLEMKHG